MSSAWDGLVNNKEKTELPHYAINKSLPADSYFTSKPTAEKCLSIFFQKLKEEEINIDDYIFIEPSTGDGCFFDLLPTDKRIGIDIIGRRDDISIPIYGINVKMEAMNPNKKGCEIPIIAKPIPFKIPTIK